MRTICIYLFFFLVAVSCLNAQSVRVPSHMEVAGIRLKITERARKEIQADVDALTSSARYFNQKVERAAEFMPIVERVFKKEGLPDDFKYLAIQESGFIADAVSSSNAVGFWQFKKESAEEVGLRVDSKIDERQNIVSASTGAAKYLQKNNYYFNNWLYALQAYQMGAGGALEAIGEKKGGQKQMTIDHKTYWYVKKFLAHKIAFENPVKEARERIPALKEYTQGAGKSLSGIASDLHIDEDRLQAYNPWLKARKIPDDKPYSVIIPAETSLPILASSVTPTASKAPAKTEEIEELKDKFKRVHFNGLPAVLTIVDMSINELSELTDIESNDLISFNDLLPHNTIEAGQVYYLKKKRSRARIYYHTVKSGETPWLVAQMYGVRLHKLMAMNRIVNKDAPLEVGRVLWLRKRRPAKTPIQFRSMAGGNGE